MQFEIKKGKVLSVFSLVMINVIAIDNLRSLTAGAEYGFALVFFYILAALLFFIPTILVTAELATGWPSTGGVYVWMREAFGMRWGFFTIWLQWIYNVVWYPTIFSFIAGVLAYLINPALVHHLFYMIPVTLIAFWGTTLLSLSGIRMASWFSTIGALIGTILPMLLIAILGFVWIYTGHPMQIHFTWHDFFPNMTNGHNLAFLTNILFGLMGIEMSAVHAGDVLNPKRDYPRALLYSSIIILLTFIFASLAITLIIPPAQLNLVSGLVDAFTLFFNAFHLGWLIPVIIVLIVVGSLSGASAWILGPARGLLIASEECQLPAFLKMRNKKEMPLGILLLQGCIVTLLCTVFFIMPSVSSSYWVLSNLTAQLALLFYIMLFAAGIRLRYKYPHVERAYRIPGGLFGTWVVCGTGMLTCILAILLGFLPPTQISVGKLISYEAILITGMLICLIFPFLVFNSRQLKKRSQIVLET